METGDERLRREESISLQAEVVDALAAHFCRRFEIDEKNISARNLIADILARNFSEHFREICCKSSRFVSPEIHASLSGANGNRMDVLSRLMGFGGLDSLIAAYSAEIESGFHSIGLIPATVDKTRREIGQIQG